MFSLSPIGSVAPGFGGCLHAEVKRIVLSCELQEVLGARNDHLSGIEPTPHP